MSELLDKSLKELIEGVKKKEFSSREILDESYAKIEKYNDIYSPFITVVEKGETSDIPFSMKDVYVTRGIKTTAGSSVLGNYIGQYDATVYKKLKQAGYVLVGKNSQDAWGHGGSSENTDIKIPKNPWDKSRVTGGSSGGSAAAVAMRIVPFAIGEDTGGSIRNPAAWCGVTGLKVSYGRVSRYGAIAYASSFDTVGPIAKSAEDCAYILEIIAGRDKYDATSSPHPALKYTDFLDRKNNFTIGVPKEFFGEGLDPEIGYAIKKAVKEFEKLGYKIEEVSFPDFDFVLALYYIIAPSETSSNLGRYDGVRYGASRDKFTEETKRRIMIGTYSLSSGYYDAYYRQAQKARTHLINIYKSIFEKCDVFVSPITPTMPPKFGELIDDPVKNYLADIYTVIQNPAGVPSLALPCGFSKAGLPIGMQIVGPMFSEERLLNVGYRYQQMTNWHLRKPKL